MGEVKALVPMAHVMNVPRSIAFYEQLGFEVRHTVPRDREQEPIWAWMTSADAQLMLAKADGPFDAGQQAVLFYLYCSDVEAYRATLIGRGISAGPIKRPFYSPRGEFRVEDPDGYVLMVSHA